MSANERESERESESGGKNLYLSQSLVQQNEGPLLKHYQKEKERDWRRMQ